MSGLKQKAKKRLGEIERTCGLTITDSLGVDVTDGVIETILEDTEAFIDNLKWNQTVTMTKIQKENKELIEEIENLKAELEKHAWYCIDCDEWHTKGKICAVHEVRKMRNGRG